ncbi:hypothetical protein Pcac1_g18307 [Phytophthora cactorum]|nr:hypothetical protein Pcac1_g18307 [Phytophthora cactorum]KAG3081395.1 hypothetical protein PC121_g6429 [Phytophthora cactorum]
MNDPTQASLSGFSPEQQKATTRNPLMPLSVVENYYEEAFAELKKCIPPCDFPDVEMP